MPNTYSYKWSVFDTQQGTYIDYALGNEMSFTFPEGQEGKYTFFMLPTN